MLEDYDIDEHDWVDERYDEEHDERIRKTLTDVPTTKYAPDDPDNTTTDATTMKSITQKRRGEEDNEDKKARRKFENPDKRATKRNRTEEQSMRKTRKVTFDEHIEKYEPESSKHPSTRRKDEDDGGGRRKISTKKRKTPASATLSTS